MRIKKENITAEELEGILEKSLYNHMKFLYEEEIRLAATDEIKRYYKNLTPVKYVGKPLYEVNRRLDNIFLKISEELMKKGIKFSLETTYTGYITIADVERGKDKLQNWFSLKSEDGLISGVRKRHEYLNDGGIVHFEVDPKFPSIEIEERELKIVYSGSPLSRYGFILHFYTTCGYYHHMGDSKSQSININFEDLISVRPQECVNELFERYQEIKKKKQIFAERLTNKLKETLKKLAYKIFEEI